MGHHVSPPTQLPESFLLWLWATEAFWGQNQPP